MGPGSLLYFFKTRASLGCFDRSAKLKDIFFKHELHPYEMNKVKDGDRLHFAAGYGRLMEMANTELQRRTIIRDCLAAARRPEQIFKNTMRERGMNVDGTTFNPSAAGRNKDPKEKGKEKVAKGAGAKKNAGDKKKVEKDKQDEEKKQWEEKNK